MTRRVYVGAFALVALCAAPCAHADAQWWNPLGWFRHKKAPESAPAETTSVKIKRDTMPKAVVPTLDPARAMDAEVNIALFDLLNDHTVSAMSRLARLTAAPPTAAAAPTAPTAPTAPASSATPAAPPASVAPSALRGRGDALFLLAEAQYRLGLDSAFTATANTVLASNAPARYVSLLRAQLLLAAYRAGDFARVASLGHDLGTQDETRGLAELVSGLGAYQNRNYADARTMFAAARQAGGAYAPYAEYMDVLTTLRGDTTQTAAAIGRLEAIAGAATGEFGDQVRVTAAQLAYQTGAYDRAIALADGVRSEGGLAPQALLTKAWAQYKSKHVPEAGQSFARFAELYSQLPQRDEARLMAAQALLEQGKTSEAGTLFHAVADTAAAEAAELGTPSVARMTDAAKVLVQTRVAGLLFVTDPSTGKSIRLGEVAGADPQVLASVMAGTTPNVPLVGATEIVSLAVLTKRFSDASTALGGEFPHRILFAPASATNGSAAFAQAASALYDADLKVALTHAELQQTGRDDAMRAAMLASLQSLVAASRDSLRVSSVRLDSLSNNMHRITNPLDAASDRIKESLARQLNTGTLKLIVDQAANSFRQQYGPGADAQIKAVLDHTLDSAIVHYPLYILRDSIRARNERVTTYFAQTQSALASLDRQVTEQLGQIRTGTPRMQQLRAAEAAAEQQRGAAETALVATVSQELSSRASELLATLQHDAQAAQFGTASASFFQTLDLDSTQTRAKGTADSASTGSSRGASDGSGGASGTTTGGASSGATSTAPGTVGTGTRSGPNTPAKGAPASPAAGTSPSKKQK